LRVRCRISRPLAVRPSDLRELAFGTKKSTERRRRVVERRGRERIARDLIGPPRRPRIDFGR
jgi:hypothetical protein